MAQGRSRRAGGEGAVGVDEGVFGVLEGEGLGGGHGTPPRTTRAAAKRVASN
jgi:hypothetical protein